MLVVESYECTKCRDGRIVFTFDAPDDFQPAGDLLSATINIHSVLVLDWANGARAALPDARDKMAQWIRATHLLCVRWSDGDLVRGAELAMT